jgi:hypothetical protein
MFKMTLRAIVRRLFLPGWMDGERCGSCLVCSRSQMILLWLNCIVSYRASLTWEKGSLKSEPIRELFQQGHASSRSSTLLRLTMWGNLHCGFKMYGEEHCNLFHGSLMKILEEFYSLRGRTHTSPSWSFSFGNHSGHLKGYSSSCSWRHDGFSNTWFLLRGASTEL